jgi:hypothetical protein
LGYTELGFEDDLVYSVDYRPLKEYSADDYESDGASGSIIFGP